MTVTFYEFALVLGLSFFLGLAFEDFYGEEPARRPGGVRTFPLLALVGAGLTLLDPNLLLAFIAGVLVLGGWLFAYYVRQLRDAGRSLDDGGVLMVPLCNLIAYLLGPLVLLQPAWLATAITVTTVLLLGWRERLHTLAHKVPAYEIITAGKFLVLTGIVLPLLPRAPVSALSPLTPYDVLARRRRGQRPLLRKLPRPALCLAGARCARGRRARGPLLLDGDDGRPGPPRPRTGRGP